MRSLKAFFSQGRRIENEYLAGLAFVSPWLIGLVLLVIYPVGASVYLSLCKYDGLTPAVYIGLDNYAKLFSDELFWKSLWNTAYITFLGVPIGVAFSLALAFLLNQKRRGIGIYRTLIYLPCLTPVVATSVLWLWLFNPEVGLFNVLIDRLNQVLTPLSLGLIHLPRPGWFSDAAWSKPALIIMGLWGAGGAMLIFLAALQDVPRSLHEAAEMDGAGWWLRQWHVTLPIISPAIFYNLVVGMIWGFQYFTQAYVITLGQGGPQDSTLFYVLYLFNQAFPFWRMGYASALAWILFFITLTWSLAVFRSSARLVYYQGD
jgi:multiple sugar transport system permease protein